jgi:hypothetical protein
MTRAQRTYPPCGMPRSTRSGRTRGPPRRAPIPVHTPSGPLAVRGIPRLSSRVKGLQAEAQGRGSPTHLLS